MYEIAVRELPYADEIARLKKKKGSNGMATTELMRNIAAGRRRPELNVKTRAACRKYGVGQSFKKRAFLETAQVLGCGQTTYLDTSPPPKHTHTQS